LLKRQYRISFFMPYSMFVLRPNRKREVGSVKLSFGSRDQAKRSPSPSIRHVHAREDASPLEVASGWIGPAGLSRPSGCYVITLRLPAVWM
jgi:hypothetical protein